MAIAVQGIVGELDFAERHRLRVPVRAQSGAVRVQVHALWGLGLSSTGGHPLAARELVATVSDGHHLQHQAVAGVLLQAGQVDAHRRKHASAREREGKNKS